jgi:hypothetical protein
MNLDRYFTKKGDDGLRDGFISPPLTCPKTSTSKQSSFKRIGLVVFTVFVLLYFCGFRVPGFGQQKQVVIILAANIGGGSFSWPLCANVGVLNVKNSGDWAMEKWSIRNKRDYAKRHGILLLKLN